MSADLSAAVEAAAQAWWDENARLWPAFATEWDDLPAATRRSDLAVMTPAVAAAAPLIEAQVRAQVAAEIEAALHEPGRCVSHGVRYGFEQAATIARGESA